jgi:2-polyprenyl-6-hydroxyphenyl methylase/3-demethylubiquinone-9 3-methyltransferase
VTGIDLAAKPLGVARLHALEAGVENLDYREIATESLAPNSRRPSMWSPAWKCSNTCPTRLRSCRPAPRWSSPGGWVFFSTLNRNPKAFLFAIVGAEYLLRMLPKGTHEYERFIRPSELARWCRDAGLGCRPAAGWSTTR